MLKNRAVDDLTLSGHLLQLLVFPSSGFVKQLEGLKDIEILSVGQNPRGGLGYYQHHYDLAGLNDVEFLSVGQNLQESARPTPTHLKIALSTDGEMRYLYIF